MSAGPKHILFVFEGANLLTYHGSTVRALCELGHKITVVIPSQTPVPTGKPAVQELVAACGGRLSVQGVQGRAWHRLAAFTVGLRELRSYGSYLRRRGQSPYFKTRWRGNLLPWTQRLAKRIPIDLLLTLPGADGFLRLMDGLLPPDKRATERVASLAPDLVVLSPGNLTLSEEYEYGKAARRLGIPTAVAVQSWDNLTTKGLLPTGMDLVLVWNESHRKQAIQIHGVAPERIRVTGSPFFDKWWDVDRSALSRDELCEKAGLDPARPYILYLGSSPAVEPSGSANVAALLASFRASPDPWVRGMQILIRPHPANVAGFEGVLQLDVALWPKDGCLPDSEQSRADFVSSVLFSRATLGLNTTGMVDAVILGHPSLCWLQESRRSTQADAVHFQELLSSGAMGVIETADDCARWLVHDHTSKGDVRAQARQDLVRYLVRPLGLSVPAGTTAAAALLELMPSPSQVPVRATVQLEPAGTSL